MNVLKKIKIRRKTKKNMPSTSQDKNYVKSGSCIGLCGIPFFEVFLSCCGIEANDRKCCRQYFNTFEYNNFY